jgi:hypothetical protein
MKLISTWACTLFASEFLSPSEWSAEHERQIKINVLKDDYSVDSAGYWEGVQLKVMMVTL